MSSFINQAAGNRGFRIDFFRVIIQRASSPARWVVARASKARCGSASARRAGADAAARPTAARRDHYMHEASSNDARAAPDARHRRGSDRDVAGRGRRRGGSRGRQGQHRSEDEVRPAGRGGRAQGARMRGQEGPGEGVPRARPRGRAPRRPARSGTRRWRGGAVAAVVGWAPWQ